MRVFPAYRQAGHVTFENYKNRHMKYLLSILLLIISHTVTIYAQVPVKISDQTGNINGKKYYIHKVEIGQTLYSVSKAYNVDREEIKRNNNLSSNEIKAGQLLKIPFTEIRNTDSSPDFFYHKVKQGETLFSLSQKYYVTVEKIIESNPVVKYGLKTDQILKIPNSFKKNREDREKKYFLYTVKADDTLYSISRKYNLTVEDLLKLNPDAKNGIKIGQTIKIPNNSIQNNDIQNNPETNDTTDNILNKGLNDPLYFTENGITPCRQFEYSKDKSFEVVLLLPLFLEQNLHYISRYSKEKDPMFYKNTKRFTELYEGVLLALQKVKSQGFSVNLKVFDTENDSLKVENIMASLNYPNVDLIIGPVYSKNVIIASEYAARHHINLISPLSKNLSLLNNNPFVFQTVPSMNAETDKISEILKQHNDSTNVIIIYDGSDYQLKIINRFKQNFSLNDTLRTLTDTSVFKIIKYDSDIKMMDKEQTKINRALKPKFNNIVYIPSDNEVFVTQVIDKLYAADDSMHIEIIGSDNWINFQNINSATFNKLSFNFVSPFYIDYSSAEVKGFIKTYRTVYETEPSFFAFQAYDITCYFLNSLRKYGRIFQFCLSSEDAFPNSHGLIYNFNFERINTHSGFENKAVFILKFNDSFQLEKRIDEQNTKLKRKIGNNY